jgi:hypothetical protein
MVTTLKAMTPTKQRRVLTLLNAKLAEHYTHLLDSDVPTHPLSGCSPLTTHNGYTLKPRQNKG